MIEIEDYGTTIMAHNIPDEADAYSMLNYCDNVEREGEGSYRFDNVYDVKHLVKLLKGN